MNEDFTILNNITKQNVYIVPDNYFENLSQNILLKINAKQTLYSVPNNYFESNVTQIMSKIASIKNNEFTTELEDIAPVLNTISKQNIYAVPNNYFNNITYASNSKNAKIVTFNTKKWYKYVAAAVLIVSVGFAYLFTVNKNDKQFAAIYKNAIQTNVATAITTINDAELNKIVEPVKANFTQEETTQTIIPFTGNMQTEVQLLSDEEIEQYINNNALISENSNS